MQNCFRHCGVVFTDVGMDHLSGDIDPFSDLDSFQYLLVHIWPELSPQEYIEADENLASGPVFDVSDSSDWREDLRLLVTSTTKNRRRKRSRRLRR